MAVRKANEAKIKKTVLSFISNFHPCNKCKDISSQPQ
jgi:hypothetical protein